jgi:hypothetical protein
MKCDKCGNETKYTQSRFFQKNKTLLIHEPLAGGTEQTPTPPPTDVKWCLSCIRQEAPDNKIEPVSSNYNY